MGEQYRKIEQLELDISQWLKGRFLKERLLMEEMVELMLESLKPLSEKLDANQDELALLTLASRIFNDIEGAKQLLLWGLPDQANNVIRDIIECMLLLRLFLQEPKKAKKWLTNLAQYQPGDVNARLLEFGIDAMEYSLYGMLSHVGHSNLLASLSHVQVIDEKLGAIYFGSSKTTENEFFIQQCFLMVFFLLHIALREPLAELYSRYCESGVFETWYGNVNNLCPKLIDITSEMGNKFVAETPQMNRAFQDLANKKMRLEDFKRRIGGSSNLP